MEDEQKNQFTQVIPFSKYIAIALFVVLIAVSLIMFVFDYETQSHSQINPETEFLVNNESMDEIPLNLIPMYGKLEGRVKNDEMVKADNDFIQGILSSTGETKKNVSVGLANGAWDWAEAGDFDTAMKRFNEAWLLDSSNLDSYKGFIFILEETSKMDNAKKIREYVKNETGVSL